MLNLHKRRQVVVIFSKSKLNVKMHCLYAGCGKDVEVDEKYDGVARLLNSMWKYWVYRKR